MMLSPAAKALLNQPVFAHLATLDERGRPHVTPMWVDVDGDHVVFNTAEGRKKARNLARSSQVAVSVVDPAEPYQRMVAFQGTVVEITRDDAEDHIDRLAKKYLGLDTYPLRQPGEVRVKVIVRPDRVLMQPAEPAQPSGRDG
jgi:PPOX class probable F420-dependent enzyme